MPPFRSTIFAAVLLSAAPLAADGDSMLRAWIEPGRDLWVEAPVDLAITFTGLTRENLAHVAPNSLSIRIDGRDVTAAFLQAAASAGRIERLPAGVRLRVRVPFAPGKHEVAVGYRTRLGGGPIFRQAFTVYDRDALRRDLGLPPRPKRRGPVAAPLQVSLPHLRPSAPPVALTPRDKAFVHTASTDLVVTWSRNGAGLVLGALKILLDGLDKTSNFKVFGDHAVWTAAPLANGKHTLVAQVADRAGNLSVASATFIVFDGTKRKPWFFAPTNIPHTLGHLHHQFQWYSGGLSSAYFHHGIDVLEPAGSSVYVSEGGRITNFYWYGRQPYYFEIEVTDADGFRWQYHHIDRNKVPATIAQIAARKGTIARGTLIGANVYWPVRSYGKLFHHIHLNVIAPDGRYVNPLNFLLPINDRKAPVVQKIYVTKNGSSTVLNPGGASGAVVSGKLDFVAKAEDLIGTQPYQLTIYRLTWQLDELGGTRTHNVPETDLWRFDYLPGGGNRFANVWDVFRYRLIDGFTSYYTAGNYYRRNFYYVLTNRIGDRVDEARGYFDSAERDLNGNLRYPNGLYRLTVRAYDIAGNVGSSSITLTLKN